MKAVVYEAFNKTPTIQNVASPDPAPQGVVIKVEATGVCRSDWHGWVGHDQSIELPHIPGHELAGIVETVGIDVTKWRAGDRVTVPFVGGCGACPDCDAGQQQVCDNQFQPGFNANGSFAEFVAIDYADTNLVRLPEAMEFATAASLGCRFVTSFRAVVDQGHVKPGQWVAVHGCGGVGLSAVMIASAMGANVVAVDISDAALALAKNLGAVAVLNGATSAHVAKEIRDITKGGAHVSLDALGHPVTCNNSISCLRKQGRHVQVGLMLGDHRKPSIPMARVIAFELEIVGTHGMQAHRYDDMFAMIHCGKLSPEKLIRRRITLEQSIDALVTMNNFNTAGVTVVTQF